MANKRMFSQTIIDSDVFIDMPSTARLLYYDLGMRADDDGFINSPKKIIKMTGASDGDMRILFENKFVIPFETGIVVIKHWKINNYIRSDRYNETKHKLEKSQLYLDENGCYIKNVGIPDGTPLGIPNDNHMSPSWDTQNRIDKNSIDKVSIDKDKSKPTRSPKNPKDAYGEYQNVKLTGEELDKLKNQFANHEELITFLDEYIEMKGYKAKNHYLAIAKWVVDAVEERKAKKKSNNSSNGKSENIFHEIGKEEGLW